MKQIQYIGRRLFLAVTMATPLWASAFDSFDFNGDHVTDLGTFKASVGSERFWYYPSGGPLSSFQLGAAGDIPLPADYDGDGKTDFAVYRPSTRQFIWVKSSNGLSQNLVFGDWGDVPIVGDFDGDGKTDITVYRLNTASFWWIRSSDGVIYQKMMNGQPGDIPLANDYDGDGISDFTLYRQGEQSTFTYVRSSTNVVVQTNYGTSGDMPLSGDYDGDGKSDIAVYRPGNSTFYYIKSTTQTAVGVSFGDPGVIPLTGDYDGDGKTDIAVFFPGSPGQFWYERSSNGALASLMLGDPVDFPLNSQTYEPSQTTAPTDTFVNSSGARQTVYLGSVPNTDRNGHPRSSIQADSFFPKGIYLGLTGMTHAGITYNYARLKNVGLNCVIPYAFNSMSTVLADAALNDMQVIRDVRIDPNQSAAPQISAIQSMVSQNVNHPNILGWLMEEEPTGAPDESTRWTNYQNLKTAIDSVDTTHLKIVLDTAWFTQPGDPSIAQEWNKWNTAGTISCHDNYPFFDATVNTMDSTLGIPNSVKQAVSINSSGKPVWLTVQAFEQPTWTANFHWLMPTPTQLRAQIFAGLIHGATGIIYFAPDSYVTRAGNVIGMAPDTMQDYGIYMTATAAQVQSSKDLWQGLPAINAELDRYKNILYTPTAADNYTVAIAGPKVSTNPIRSLLKKRDNLYTLFVVNLDKATIKTKVTLPRRPVDLRNIALSGVSEVISPYGAVFYDTLGPYESRVYQYK